MQNSIGNKILASLGINSFYNFFDHSISILSRITSLLYNL